MVRKYIILAVTAALLSPCLLSFADDDLQDQLDHKDRKAQTA